MIQSSARPLQNIGIFIQKFVTKNYNYKIVGYDVKIMQEWTDGCSAQYKSRHCMGDVAQSSSDFGYMTIRNFFETSHAKGPQDGAGANQKHKADMAVIKRQVYFTCLNLIHIILDLCLLH